MATCNINNLLEEGKCFAALPPFILSSIALQEWCDISPPPGSTGGWYDPDVPGGWNNPDNPGPIVNPDL